MGRVRRTASSSERIWRMTLGYVLHPGTVVGSCRAPQLLVRPEDFVAPDVLVRPAQAINGSSNIGISSEE
jgi:hypothetical protein